MARVTVPEVQGWLDGAKITISTLDTALVDNIETETLSRLESIYDVSGWTNDTNTPKIIKTVITKYYASWLIDRFYSENQDGGSDYAKRLCDNADMVMTGIIDGQIIVSDVPGGTPVVPESSRTASFYPTDASSSQIPTTDDPSLGGPYFSLGKAF
jgi:hypothetical protein